MWIERTVRYKSTRRLSRRQLWCAYICLYLLMLAVVIWASIYLALDPENYRWHKASVSIVGTGNHVVVVATAPPKPEATQQEHEVFHPGMAPQELHVQPNISQVDHDIKPQSISPQKPGVIIGADMGHLQTMKPQVDLITFRYTQKFTQQILVNISRNITSHLVAVPHQLVVEEDEEKAAASPTTTGAPDAMTAPTPGVNMQLRPAIDAIKRRPADILRAEASVRGSRLAGSEHQLQRKILFSSGRKKAEEGENDSGIPEVSGTLIKNSLGGSTGGPQLREGILVASEFDEGTGGRENGRKEILEVAENSDSGRRDRERDEGRKIAGVFEFWEGNSSILIGDSGISTVAPEFSEEIPSPSESAGKIAGSLEFSFPCEDYSQQKEKTEQVITETSKIPGTNSSRMTTASETPLINHDLQFSPALSRSEDQTKPTNAGISRITGVNSPTTAKPPRSLTPAVKLEPSPPLPSTPGEIIKIQGPLPLPTKFLRKNSPKLISILPTSVLDNSEAIETRGNDGKNETEADEMTSTEIIRSSVTGDKMSPWEAASSLRGSESDKVTQAFPVESSFLFSDGISFISSEYLKKRIAADENTTTPNVVEVSGPLESLLEKSTSQDDLEARIDDLGNSGVSTIDSDLTSVSGKKLGVSRVESNISQSSVSHVEAIQIESGVTQEVS